MDKTKSAFDDTRGAALDSADANWVYDMLVTTCDAKEDERPDFLRYVTKADGFAKEWRFRGSLGFGGKFYFDGRRASVSCYDEDRNNMRDMKVAEAKAKLKEYFANA